MKLYVVTSGVYSDYMIQKIFTDKKQADLYVERYNKVEGEESSYGEATVEEYEVTEKADEIVSYLHMAISVVDKWTQPNWGSFRLREKRMWTWKGDKEHDQPCKSDITYRDRPQPFLEWGWAFAEGTDFKRVRKRFSEIKAEFIVLADQYGYEYVPPTEEEKIRWAEMSRGFTTSPIPDGETITVEWDAKGE